MPRLFVLDDRLTILRLPPDAAVPALSGPFWSITRTGEELSIVCTQESAPESERLESGWRAIKVEGPLDFNLTGILAGIASPLAQAGISIFAISTFDTDFVLVREEHLESAIDALRSAGHEC